MKFCSLLRETAKEIPDIQLLYDSYKGLKKTLKRIAQCQQSGEVEEAAQLQENFVHDLRNYLSAVNDRFIEREELRVIEMGHLEEAARAAHTEARCQELVRRFVDFHGQMLLFIHSAMLGYTSLLKILKKYAKKTGHQVEEFQRQRLRSMPICQTEIANSLAQRADGTIDVLLARRGRLRAAAGEATQSASGDQSGDDDDRASARPGQVRVALFTWEELKSTAATPSTVPVNLLAAFHIPSVSGSVSSQSPSVRSESS